MNRRWSNALTPKDGGVAPRELLQSAGPAGLAAALLDSCGRGLTFGDAFFSQRHSFYGEVNHVN